MSDVPDEKEMPIAIQRINAHNVNIFERIAEDVFDEPIHPERLAAYLAEPSHLLAVAVRDGEIVGQIAGVLHRHPDKPTELYIDEVGVAPLYHRKGIGKQLLQEMTNWGKERGATLAWLGTEIDNEPAKALYVRYAKGETILFYEWNL